MRFLEHITKLAKEDKKTIVLPEAFDRRVVEAASMVLERDIADIILIGRESEVKETARGLDISRAQIIDPATYDGFEDFAQKLYELRKAKGMTLEQARETLKNPLYFGVMLVKENKADGMVAGAVHSTSDTLRPALQILKTAPGVKLVSAFFIMDVPDCSHGHNGIFLYADSGLVENPDAEQLSEIAIVSAESFKTLVRAEPKVAMLSYSTYGSASSELTKKVVEATKLAKEKRPDLVLDGELQADAALVQSVSRKKAPGNVIDGQANVLIFPDLNSGNIAYKLTQRLAKAEAYGPITQGIAKPVNDLSRGCVAEDIVGVVAITAVQAQQVK